MIRALLSQRHVRDREGTFILESPKPILELLFEQPGRLLAVVVAPSFLSKQDVRIRQALLNSRVAVYQCPEQTLARFSEVETTPGILSIVSQPHWDEASVIMQPVALGLFGESLRDPMNIGAIVRTAGALGVTAIWLTPDSVDVFNPKVVRATAGAVLTLPIFRTATIDHLVQRGWAVLAADPGHEGTIPIDRVRAIAPRMLLALGNESRGLSSATLNQARVRFRIPLTRRVDSLNVAAAAAIAIFHLRSLQTRSAHGPTPERQPRS